MAIAWPPPAELIPTLPVDVLGISLLRSLAKRGDRFFYRYQIVGNGSTVIPARDLDDSYHTNAIYDVISEAWDWLYVQGLTSTYWQQKFATSAVPTTVEEVRIITRRGRSVADAQQPELLLQSLVLIGRDLHAAINEKAQLLFAIGEFESAVLMAFRELEIRVRDAGDLSTEVYGPNLMREAFNPEKPGPLTDVALQVGERRAVADLFAGAMGAIKNPLSHRTVDYGDPVIAAGQLLFADLLHRMLDGLIANAAARPTHDAL